MEAVTSSFLEKIASQWMFFTEKHEKNTAKNKKKQAIRSRFLYHEPLEERLPVSTSILGVAAGAALAASYDNHTSYATEAAEYRNDTTNLDALTEIQLDALSAQLGTVDAADSRVEFACESRTNDVTPEITSDFNTESSVDLTQQFGDDLFFTQMSTLDVGSLNFGNAAIFSDIDSAVMTNNQPSGFSSQGVNVLDEAVLGVQAVDIASIGSNGFNGLSSGGDSGPQYADIPPGQRQNTPYDVFINADLVTSVTIPYGDGISSKVPSVSSLTVNTSSGFSGATYIAGTASITIFPTGGIGSGTITLFPTASAQPAYTLTINVHAFRVIGYEVEEKDAAGNWKKVHNTGTTWDLIWTENDYRWRPILDGLAFKNVRSTSFANINWDQRGVITTGTTFAGKTLVDDDHWAYGKPGTNGEFAIIPSIIPKQNSSPVNGVTTEHYIKTNMISDRAPLKWTVNAAETKDKPRIGKTEISKVEWEQIDGTTNAIKLGDNPGANGGGLRCFPEQSTPTASSLNDKINVKVTLAYAIPAGMAGHVNLAIYDPNNPIGSTKTINHNGVGERDNHGKLRTSDDNYEVTFASGEIKNTKEFSFSSQKDKEPGKYELKAHAGDNYIVTAHPNAGVESSYTFAADGVTLQRKKADGTKENLPNALKTPILTVWRTLNVECDYANWTGAPSADIRDPATYLGGIVASELARACVVPKEFPNVIPIIFDIEYPMSRIDYQRVLEDMIIPCGRDIYGDCDEFWTVRIVMASQIDLYTIDPTWGHSVNPGFFQSGYNTIFIFYETINISSQNAGSTMMGNATESVLLHEIGHVLSLDDLEIANASEGVMKSPIPFMQTLLPEFRKFLDSDITQIQQISKPLF
ncbi:MAG: hypothetical protein ACRC2T_07180 [Thermoguttaceae bacterium]